MNVRHRTVALEFVLLPISLLVTAALKPNRIYEKAKGDAGVVYSLAAAAWTVFLGTIRNLNEARLRGDEFTAKVINSATSLTFGLELLVLPLFLFYVFIFWIMIRPFAGSPSDRRELLSLALILFFLLSFPALSLSLILPELVANLDLSLTALSTGQVWTWFYLLVLGLLGYVLFQVNARKLATSTGQVGLNYLYFAVVFFVVVVGWYFEPRLMAATYVTLAVYVECPDLNCFFSDAPRYGMRQFTW